MQDTKITQILGINILLMHEFNEEHMKNINIQYTGISPAICTHCESGGYRGDGAL